MAKKLEANGFWESSRMILPEHREAALRQAAEVHAVPRPTLDEQEIVLISEALMRSKAYKQTISITLYTGYDPRTLTGTVTKFDRTHCRIDLAEGDWEWIAHNDILKAEPLDEWLEEITQFLE